MQGACPPSPKNPSSQVQYLLPETVEVDPAGQALQGARPVSLKVPAAHNKSSFDWHCVPPTAGTEVWPARQGKQGAVPSGLKYPSGQMRQSLLPMRSLVNPRGQGSQGPRRLALKYPTSHMQYEFTYTELALSVQTIVRGPFSTFEGFAFANAGTPKAVACSCKVVVNSPPLTASINL